MGSIQFEVLINDEFLSNLDSSFQAKDNEKVLSLVNDFEDGKWRITKFQNFIWDNIAETALSKDERDKLSDQSHSKLIASAKNLRLTDKDGEMGKGSELAEILLYGIMKHYYKALPIVPKIFYKQNSQDNAKGSDSVHLVIENDNDFSIWLGESKFYKDLASAMTEAIKSIKDALSTEKLKKENRIITGLRDIDGFLEDNIELLNKIRDFLNNENSIDIFKPKLHIPILLLHECEKTKNSTIMTEQYKKDLKIFHIQQAQVYFNKQINTIGTLSQYSEIKFHLILFPIPDKQQIVDKFICNVQFYKGQ